jgi:hypothetical protein
LDRPLAGFYLIGGYELDGRRVHVLADAGQTKTRVVLADEA